MKKFKLFSKGRFKAPCFNIRANNRKSVLDAKVNGLLKLDGLIVSTSSMYNRTSSSQTLINSEPSSTKTRHLLCVDFSTTVKAKITVSISSSGKIQTVMNISKSMTA